MILVTGGAGFIGCHTVAALCEQGSRVRVLDDLSSGRRENLAHLDVELVVGSVADADVVRRSVEGCTHVVHLAARPSVPGSCEDPVSYDVTNVHGTVVVMQAAREAGVERVVYASSSAVYGSRPDLPKRETDPLQVESPYAAAKAADELYAATFSRTLGLSCVGLRYFNVFGPRQDPNGPYAAVIPRFVERALQGRPLTVFGDGEQGRDFVSVRDVARANLLAMVAPDVDGQVFNVGTGEMTTVNQLARYVLDAVETDSEVEHLPERPGDVRFSVSDIARTRSALSWAPREDFAAAMNETIAWYRRALAAQG